MITIAEAIKDNERVYMLDWSRPWISLSANHRSFVSSIGHPHRPHYCSLDSAEGQEIMRGIIENRIPYFRSMDNVMQVTYIFQEPQKDSQ